MIQNKQLRDVVITLKQIEEAQGKEVAAELGYFILQFLALKPEEQGKLIYQYFDRFDKRISKLEEEMADYAN